MHVNWDDIKYLFNVPLRWFRDISDAVGHAYGTAFISVRQDGRNGGVEIGIDEDAFAQRVRDIAGEPETGAVKTVDGISPDADGNVPLGAVRSVNGEIFPDADGDVEIDLDGVKTVNGVAPDTDGNVEAGTVRSVNGILPDANGNVEVEPETGTVKTVDGISPDADGNVQLNAVSLSEVDGPGSIVSPSGAYDQYVCNTAHGHDHDAIADWDEATENFLTTEDVGVSVAEKEHTHVSSDITDLPDFSQGETATFEVVTKVNWNGTSLTYDVATLTFSGGILTGRTPATGHVIDTPYRITWS